MSIVVRELALDEEVVSFGVVLVMPGVVESPSSLNACEHCPDELLPGSRLVATNESCLSLLSSIGLTGRPLVGLLQRVLSE